MKLKLLALVAMATLLLGGVAFAKTNRLKGKVKGDANSRVSLKVVLKRKHGRLRPAGVRSVKVSKVNYKCVSGTTGEKSFSFKRGKVKRVGPRGHRVYAIELDKSTAEAVNYSVTGTVNRRGTKVKGSVEYTFSEFGLGGEPDCSSGNVRFSAKR